MHLLKHVLGYGLIALPFVVWTGVMVKFDGWRVAMGVIGATAFLLGTIGLGVYLIK
jgi:hypothetical protein